MAYTASYTAGDLGSMAIDVVGGLFNGLANNATTLGSLVVIVVIVVLVTDLLTGVFGIFAYLRHAGR